MRFSEAFKRLDAGDDEGYMMLMTGKDLPPDHIAKFEARQRKDRTEKP